MAGRTPDSVSGETVIRLGRHGLVSDMSVIGFLVGMVLARHAPCSADRIARELSAWLDGPVRVAELRPALAEGLGRGWLRQEARLYALEDAGLTAIRGFYAGLVRMLDGGKRLLDVGIFMSLVRDFEGKGQ